MNNAVTYGGGTYYMASTALSALPDNAVIRWEFSEAFGADLGLDGAYVPTAVDTGTGLYDWTTAAYFAPRFTRANKTTLISKMADHTNKADAAYANALTALETLTNTQSAVDTAAAAL